MEMVFDLKGKVARKVAKFQEMKKQRGVTLLEIIIVLGIIGIIAAGVVILAQRAFNAQDMTDVQDNLTSIRTAMVDAYKDDPGYPASVSPLTLSKSNIGRDSQSTNASAINTLVRLGKISPEEAFNSFSNDAFQIDPAMTDANATVAKGFVILVNGMDGDQCRGLLSQMGNQWDYVETVKATGGSFITTDVKMDTAATGKILKSLVSEEITATKISASGVCAETGASNGILFGSK